MALVKKNKLRYAHATGHTDVCYSGNGRFLVTCGSDGDMRIWHGIQDEDPYSRLVASDKALTVACHGNRVYVGSDFNCVLAYELPDCSKDGVITRFTAPVTHIDLSPDGLYLASGSCDTEVHVTNTKDYSGFTLKGHRGPVLSVAMDPLKEYVASSSCDGTVIVWSLQTQNQVKLYSGVCAPSNDFNASGTLVRIAWQAETGSFLAIPMRHEIVLLCRSSWISYHTFTDPIVEHLFITSSFSPCGRMLAATSSEGHLSVWEVSTKDLVLSEVFEEKLPLCGNAWKPGEEGEGEIAVCNKNGCLGTVVLQFPSESGSRWYIEGGASTSSDKNDSQLDIETEFIIGQELMDDSPKRSSSPASSVSTDSSFDKEMAEAQSAFQPTSTDLSAKEAYLVWNDVGIVTTIAHEKNMVDKDDKDDDYWMVFVHFHNPETHSQINLPNRQRPDVVALTMDVLVIAEKSETGNSASSKVECILLKCWGGPKQWSTELPAYEKAIAMAAGDSFIAIATNKRNLRIFSLVGNQREILSIPGSVVCLAANQEQLMIVYHAVTGRIEDQTMTMLLLKVGTYSVSRLDFPQAIPLSSGVLLLWAGFTDEGNPCVYDEEKYLRVLGPSGLWYTLCDTKLLFQAGRSNNIFMIGVNTIHQRIRGVLCKKNQHPCMKPMPNMSVFPIKMPVCEPHTKKGEMEDEYLRCKLSLANLQKLKTIKGQQSDSSNSDEEEGPNATKMQYERSLFALFSIASRQGQSMRACELYSWMPRQRRETARRFVNSTNNACLLERLEKLDLEHETDPVQEVLRSQGYETYLPSQLVKPQVQQGSSYSVASCSNDIPIESLLQAAKRAKLENHEASCSSASTSFKSNVFSKTNQNNLSTPAPLAVVRRLGKQNFGLLKQSTGLWRNNRAKKGITKSTSNKEAKFEEKGIDDDNDDQVVGNKSKGADLFKNASLHSEAGEGTSQASNKASQANEAGQSSSKETVQVESSLSTKKDSPSSPTRIEDRMSLEKLENKKRLPMTNPSETGDAKKMKTTSKLQGFAFNKN